jgi:TPP-dependent pyruvate/acetoin dehydrogenase alpha subunit
MALAERERDSGAVTTVFLGDGTLGQGTVYECLNISSLWSLPLLFVVENNGYAQSTPSEFAVAGSVVGRAAPFGVEATEIDSTDVAEIHAAVGPIVDTVRESGRPHFLVLDTYRFSPHSKGDDDRDPAEIEERRQRDPLRLTARSLDDGAVATIGRRVEDRLAATLEQVDAAPAAGS